MNIPVYYHIPKCGGTYILYLYQYLSKENEKKKRKPSGKWDNKVCRNIEVFIDNNRYIEITAIIEISDLQNMDCDINSYRNSFSLSELYDLINLGKIDITSIFIQPTGDGNMLDSKRKVDELVRHINKKPVYFTVIRNVFQRLYSEYAYLTDMISDHEPSAAIYRNYNNFDKFLIEFDGYDNLITRQIAFGSELNNKTFDSVKTFFDNFTIADMKNIHSVSVNIWLKCYNFIPEIDQTLFYKHDNKKKKHITINDISVLAKEKFLQKTEWDRKLYAYLSHT